MPAENLLYCAERRNPMMTRVKDCPECGGRNLFETSVEAGGGYAPNYLPGLGTFWKSAKFRIVLCQDCGLTRWFAPDEARQKVSAASKWTRVP